MMFQSLTHNLFEDIKVEPLNYYVNTGNESYTNQSSSMMCSAYKDDISKVNMSYDGLPITSKEKTVYEDHSVHMLSAERHTIKSSIRNNPNKRTKRQTCKICNKTLASPSSYYVHMKQHSDNKPYSCTRCLATFCRKPYLEVHMRVHTGERPYECDICKKRFTQKSSLNTHKRSHSGLRPYSCPLCMKTFTVKSYLTAHRWAHISDSGIACNDCDLTFTNKQLYLQHLQVHNRKDFQCNECKRLFSKESYLIRHTNRFHNKFSGA